MSTSALTASSSFPGLCLPRAHTDISFTLSFTSSLLHFLSFSAPQITPARTSFAPTRRQLLPKCLSSFPTHHSSLIRPPLQRLLHDLRAQHVNLSPLNPTATSRIHNSYFDFADKKHVSEPSISFECVTHCSSPVLSRFRTKCFWRLRHPRARHAAVSQQRKRPCGESSSVLAASSSVTITCADDIHLEASC